MENLEKTTAQAALQVFTAYGQCIRKLEKTKLPFTHLMALEMAETYAYMIEETVMAAPDSRRLPGYEFQPSHKWENGVTQAVEILKTLIQSANQEG